MAKYITNAQIRIIVDDILSYLEVAPLSHRQKVEYAYDCAEDRFVLRISRSAALLAVKLANLGWEAYRMEVAAALAEGMEEPKLPKIAATVEEPAPLKGRKRSSLDQFI